MTKSTDKTRAVTPTSAPPQQGGAVKPEDKDTGTTPMDVETIDGRPKDEYDRFTKSQKKRMTAIVSFSALLSRTFSSHSLPQKLISSNGFIHLLALRPPSRK
jgi:hypothetical protein